MTLPKQITGLLVCAFIVFLSACAPQAGASPDSPAWNTPGSTQVQLTQPSSNSPDFPPQAAIEAQKWLAEQLNQPVGQIEIVKSEPADWTDTCLGLGQPNEACGQMIVNGWRITLRAGGQDYEIRADQGGSSLRSPQVVAPAQGQGAAGALTGVRWTLVSFRESGVETPVLAGSSLTLELSPDGQVSGSGGCNGFGGTYQAQDGEIHFGELMSTLMACADDAVTQQETKFLQALQSAAGYELKDGGLVIQYNGDQGLLTFAPGQPAPAVDAGPAQSPDTSVASPVEVTWVREQFGEAWNVEYPEGWAVDRGGEQEGAIQLDGPSGKYHYKVKLNYPIGILPETLAEWVEQELSTFSADQRQGMVESETTAAGMPAVKVLNVPTPDAEHLVHRVYVWRSDTQNPRLISIAQIDDLPFDGAALEAFLDRFLEGVQ